MGFWQEEIKETSNGPFEEWIKGVRNSLERNDETNVTISSDVLGYLDDSSIPKAMKLLSQGTPAGTRPTGGRQQYPQQGPGRQAQWPGLGCLWLSPICSECSHPSRLTSFNQKSVCVCLCVCVDSDLGGHLESKDFLVIDRAPLVKNLCSSRHPLEDEWNINKQSKDMTQPTLDKCPRAREFERRGRRWLCPQYGERYSSIPVADQGRKRCFAGTYTGGQWQEGDGPQTPL
ncbi:uncharacterized protein LOC125110982 [Phacochoerus africanus]|uniref:uncharacterized protein LOC125110982 n=1 Tax=Phacochoerus africanus TaxID=41426 RepID=UPI001FD8A69F|nr:uncharacterized protein LOC125110982 [Phacochoerus africanus]